MCLFVQNHRILCNLPHQTHKLHTPSSNIQFFSLDHYLLQYFQYFGSAIKLLLSLKFWCYLFSLFPPFHHDNFMNFYLVIIMNMIIMIMIKLRSVEKNYIAHSCFDISTIIFIIIELP